MESNPSTVMQNSSSRLSSRRIWGCVRILIGIAVLVVLYNFGNLDFEALVPLSRAPWTVVAAGALVFMTLPLMTLRWAILLRALDIAIPIFPLFRIICISAFVSQVLFGPTSADAVRGIYAWRVLHRGAGRVAISILVDRVVGLFALIFLAVALVTLRWERVRAVPELTVLTLSLVACAVVVLVSGAVLLAAPSLLLWNPLVLHPHHRISRFLNQVQDVLMAFRHRPAAICAIVLLSLMIQSSTVIAFVIIARSLRIGGLSLLDVSVAAPLAIVANILPFTPGGLGVGEAAFDQLCRWLAPASVMAPYASIFFAFRAVSLVTLIPGPILLVVDRNDSAQSERSKSISEKRHAPLDPH